MQFRRGKNGVTKIIRDTYRKKPAPTINGNKLVDDWWTLKKRVLLRDGGKCRQCGRPQGAPDPKDPSKKMWLHVHHIRPLTKGGTTVMSNLITLCDPCHHTKHRHHF